MLLKDVLGLIIAAKGGDKKSQRLFFKLADSGLISNELLCSNGKPTFIVKVPADPRIIEVEGAFTGFGRIQLKPK